MKIPGAGLLSFEKKNEKQVHAALALASGRTKMGSECKVSRPPKFSGGPIVPPRLKSKNSGHNSQHKGKGARTIGGAIHWILCGVWVELCGTIEPLDITRQLIARLA